MITNRRFHLSYDTKIIFKNAFFCEKAKNLPNSRLSILKRGIIQLSDATSCDENCFYSTGFRLGSGKRRDRTLAKGSDSKQKSELSPIPSSATSYTPKSLSSIGQRFSWCQTNIDVEIHQHSTKSNIHSLTDIDSRLDSLTW